MPREHLWKEKGAALSASLTIKKKKNQLKILLSSDRTNMTCSLQKSNCSSFSPKSSSGDNYIFKVQRQSKFLFITRRPVRLIFLTKLLKYFQHLFIECGQRRDFYRSRPLFNIFVLCPGLVHLCIKQCTYQTCHSRMRGCFVSAMFLYGKVRGINIRAQVFSSGL